MVVYSVAALMVAAATLAAPADLPSWEFDNPADLQAWQPNAALTNVVVKDSAVSADTKDWDPFFSCRQLSFEATPWQYVLIRIRATKPGTCELFWSGKLEGENGGLSQSKSTHFEVKGDGQWQECALFPFWQGEGTIRQLRFDVFDATHFDVDWIRVLAWGGGAAPVTDTFSWALNGDPSAWRVTPASSTLFAPPLRVPVEGKGWVAIQLTAQKDGVGSFLWADEAGAGLQSRHFIIRGDGRNRAYNIELNGDKNWAGNVVALGLSVPDDVQARLDSVSIGEEPSGPADLEVKHFGFENEPNRAGVANRVILRIANRGGAASAPLAIKLELPAGLALVEGTTECPLAKIDYDDYADLTWAVKADQPGQYDVRLTVSGDQSSIQASAALKVSAPLNLAKADYVPEPRPIKTSTELCMYYFPGWNSAAKWDCVRQVAPIRKPVLGYYEEGNPECVDWQIKWAVENGISCFLVDWYWVKGSQHLTHWFDAYRKARYRDQLKVAIMWANHNPAGTHSKEDWRAVTQHWIDNYFNLPAYYQIDGKPAVFIWAPSNLRNDVGGVEAAQACLAESQAQAKAAGYAGITFVAMGYDFNVDHLNACKKEGYVGVTTYHEWGKAPDVGPIPQRKRFEDIVSTVEEAWAGKDKAADGMTYYPVIDTGWDSRPWHGDNYLVINGRTPDLFEQLLVKAKDYAGRTNKRVLVLGPANEWGEGSYVEPCTEYGFEMYERVRKVFGVGDPASWPVNVAPSDVGRGPYDYPAAPPAGQWTFDTGTDGWASMMGIGEFAARDGALRFTTTSSDPAITASLGGMRAQKYPAAEISMQVSGAAGQELRGQLFWAPGSSSASEASSVSFTIQNDGAMHTYRLDLKANPRWRGRISTLRFDPCNREGCQVVVDSFVMVKEP